ncbi:MAG: hypothetical protein ACI4I4_06035 [Acutalibacteraceae bacterium]
MIKGINRQIIEVSDTGNLYYERAILVVRPQFNNADAQLLEKEARYMVKNIKAPSFMRKKKPFMYWLLRLGCAALFGGAVVFAVMSLL